MILLTLTNGAEVRNVTLGLVAPPNEANAVSLTRGVQLAVADANETGRVSVELKVRSENGQWGSAGNDAVALVCNEHVDAIVAPSDGAATHLILQVSGRTRVPVASVCADSSVTDAGIPWAFRVVPRTDQEVAALLRAAQATGGTSLRWWAVVPSDRAGRAVRRDLEAGARLSGSVLDHVIEGGAPKADVASLARTIIAAAPGGVLIWLPPASAGTLVASLRAGGYTGRLVGSAQLNSSTFVDAAHGAASGFQVIGFQPASDEPARIAPFAAHFQQKFGTSADASAAAAYDAAHVLIETLCGGGNRSAYQQFPITRPIAGATGDIHFDPAGNRSDALQVLVFQGGQFVPVPSNKS